MLCSSKNRPRGRQVFASTLVSITLAWSFAAAAEPTGEPAKALTVAPTALNVKSLPLDQVAVETLRELDLPAIRAEDALHNNDGAPYRFAIPQQVHITPFTHGTWEQIDPKVQLWRLRVEAPTATHLNFGFTRSFLPAGAQLYIYSADQRASIRPFTEADNAEHGQLWTPIIAGRQAVIELTIPVEVLQKLELELTTIGVGYRGYMMQDLTDDSPTPRSGSCNMDVACSPADPWRLQVHGVSVLQISGSLNCTSFMVNNTAQDLKPYLMTAAHCGVTSGTAASVVAYWNFENSTCRPPGSGASGGPGDGLLTQFNSGSTFRAGNSTSDFTLVELSSSPNPAWNVSWLGWDRNGLNPPDGACIHHPSVDEKRLTFWNSVTHPSHGSSWPCSAFPGPGADTHIRVYWDPAPAFSPTIPQVTEGGSSGSPLFDNNKRVIGQLHGGPSACGSTGDNLSDCYGRISTSWTGGGTPATRLSDWLDPLATGVTFLDTISGGGLTVSPASNVLSIGPVGGPFTNDTVVYTLTNPTPNPINYQVSLSIDFGVLINGGNTPISGTLPPTGGTTNITVTYGAAINSLAAGVYVESIVFDDLSNSRSTTRNHTIEIGQANFTVTPANGLLAGGPVGGPFPGTQVYTLTSTRPTACQVQISANQPWISIDGGTSPVVVNLPTNGSTANVTIGYSAAANSLSAGLYNGTVSFTNQSTPPQGDTTRPVTLDVGRFTYASLDVPKPIADNATVSSVINVADAYCVGDIQIDLNATHTYVGDLRFVLSHDTTTVTVINRPQSGGGGNCSSNDYNIRLEDSGAGGSIQTTCGASSSDPTPTSPPSYTPANPLAAFNGKIVTGTWTLTVSDLATTDTGSLNSWSLRIASSGAICPPEASNMAVSVPDSITTPINLAITSSVPASLNAIILSLPANATLSDPNGGPITTVPYTLLNNAKIVNFKPASYYIGPTSFTFKGNDGQDSGTATANVTVVPGTPIEVIYNFPLDSDPGWAVMGQWAFGHPTGGGSHGFDPANGFTGTNVYGYNLAGDYPNSLTPVQYLTTTALNLTGVVNTSVEFRRWLGIESASFDHATVDVSGDNGGAWTNVYNHTAGSFSETSWSLQTYDISATADGQAAAKLRWGMGTTDGSVTYPGWNIDDIQIKGRRAPLLGDINADNVRDGTDFSLFIDVLLGIDTNELHVSRTDVNIDGKADGKDVQAWVSLP